ncbi:MAG: hypothetical protein MUF81_17375 [Verrucomicrobia bacterium]|nr:hypothetical protein [Verrucomicrobiota bacterium]
MNLKCLFTVALVTVAGALAAAPVTPELFVFDNGVGRGQWTPEQQAATIKELGYAGISYNYTSPEDLVAWQIGILLPSR